MKIRLVLYVIGCVSALVYGVYSQYKEDGYISLGWMIAMMFLCFFSWISLVSGFFTNIIFNHKVTAWVSKRYYFEKTEG